MNYMTTPLIKDSVNLAELVPRFITADDCAATLVKEGDRTVLVIMLLIARFIEAFVTTISLPWVIGLLFFQLLVSAIFIFSKRPKVSQGPPDSDPSPALVESTFKAFEKSQLGNLFRQSVKVSNDI